MCIGGSKAPSYKPPPEPAIAPEAPRLADEGVQQARTDDKRKQRTMAGRSSTIKAGLLTDTANTTNGGLLS